MANVKISNLPVETNVNSILGFAGYNAAGTCKISGADLINTLPSPKLEDVLTAGNEAIDQEITFKTTSDIRVLTLDKNGLSMSNFATDLLISANSGGRLFLNSNSNDVVLQALGTGGVVFNTSEIKLQSSDVLDSTSSAGSAGEVLSSLGAGNGTEWITAGGATPTLQQVVNSGNTADSNGNTGTIVLTNSTQNRTATYSNDKIEADYGFAVLSEDFLTLTAGDGDVFIQADGNGNDITLKGDGMEFQDMGIISLKPNTNIPGVPTSGFSMINADFLLEGYNQTSSQGGNIRLNSRGNMVIHTGNLSTTTPGGSLSLYARGNTASLSTIDGTTIGGNVTISSSSGDVVITGGENLILTNGGLGTPAVGDVLTAKTTGGIAEWTTPSSGGGGGYTALTSAASTVWDGSNGLSASWQPTATTPFNTLDMSSGFSAGDRGSLVIDVSTTTNFILPSNSKAADGDISVSGVNKTILDYVYDGTNFYWSNRKNMIDPIYLPTVSTTNLVSFYIPSQYQGVTGNVPIGSAWVNSYTSNNLVGDLSRVGSTSSSQIGDVQFVAKDDVNEIPAHFLMGSDGSTSSYWNVASALGGNVLGGSWTGAMWFKTISTTSSGFHGLMDPDKDDDESIYVYNKRLYIEGAGLYTNFPSFEPATTGGNDNAFSLEDEWIYVSVSFDHPNNTMSVIIACQATLTRASQTIIGYDGSNINISADGTYQETLSATLTDNTWDDFAYGASVSSSGTAFSLEGGIGLAAVYGTNITDTLAISNWNATKEYYYIS